MFWDIHFSILNRPSLFLCECSKIMYLCMPLKSVFICYLYRYHSDQSNVSFNNTEINVMVFIIVCCLLCIIITVLYYKWRKSKQQIKAKTLPVTNPMVISIAIGRYDKQPDNPDIDAELPNLDEIRIDIDNVTKLFGKHGLNYQIIPNYDDLNESEYKIRWTEQELVQFLQEQSNKLEQNLSNKEQENHYDGLIVIISCHGMGRYILTSDYKAINQTAIHRIFSGKKPLSRKIPRIFVFDCCSGNNERKLEKRIIEECDQSKSPQAKVIMDTVIRITQRQQKLMIFIVNHH